MKTKNSLEGGAAGALALTLIHQLLKKTLPNAPRLDLLGMQALAKTLKSVKAKLPDENNLYRWTLAGDIITNAVYYSLSGIGNKKYALLRCAALGLAAGISAVILPQHLNLSDTYTNRNKKTRMITIGLYMAGGVIAAAVMKKLSKDTIKKQDEWQRKLVTSSMG